MRKFTKKNTRIQTIETKLGGNIEEILRRLYVDEHMSAHDIARTLNVTYLTVIRWLRHAGIYSRRLHIKGGSD